MNPGFLIALVLAVLLAALMVWVGVRSARRAAVKRATSRLATPEPGTRPATTPPATPEPETRPATDSLATAGSDSDAAAAAPSDGLHGGDDLALIRECFEQNKKRAAELRAPAIFMQAYRDIRTWATSFAPGRPCPAILSDPEIVGGRPTTYRFRLKNQMYSIVKNDLTGEHGEPGRPAQERLQFVEGTWIGDLEELNTLFSRDTKRISDDFRKKFRAKEAERLKRDIGV
jgi:hypothetical protein